jgi:ribosomal protein L37AE/L43A/DNA-directed RNA polymerase subunit RPC12/RpoP
MQTTVQIDYDGGITERGYTKAEIRQFPTVRKIYHTGMGTICPHCGSSIITSTVDDIWKCCKCGAHRIRPYVEKFPMSSVTTKEIKHIVPCKHCGVNLEIWSTSRNEVCPSCAEIKRNERREHKKKGLRYIMARKSYQCESCGARIERDEYYFASLDKTRKWCKESCARGEKV